MKKEIIQVDFNLKECRDFLAKDDGLVFSPSDLITFDYWHYPDSTDPFCMDPSDHPYEESIDVAARSVSEDWDVSIVISKNKNDQRQVTIYAFNDLYLGSVALVADSEILARFRLAVACRMIEKKEKKEIL